MTATATKPAKTTKTVKPAKVKVTKTEPAVETKTEKATKYAPVTYKEFKDMTNKDKSAAVSTVRAEMRKLMTFPQARVLRILAVAKGPLTRTEITKRNKNKTGVVVGRAIGYSDAEKRAAFVLTRDGVIAGTPLLDSGFVTERELDIEGEKHLVVEITKKGRAAVEKYMELYEHFTKLTTGKASRTFPGLNDHWNTEEGTEEAAE